MALYAGVNLFGSGPCRVTVQPEAFAIKFSEYAGLNGREALYMGGRGRRIRIAGQLKAANVVALNILIAAIEAYRRLGPATLIDNDGVIWYNVALERFDIIPPKKYTSVGVFVEYVISAVQL